MKWIKNIVDGLVETYNTRNVYELVGLLEINIIRKKLPNNKKGRFLRNAYGDEFIFLSDDLTSDEEIVVLSHELGHLILHPELSISFYTSSLVSKNKLELQANKFVSYLLIDDNLLDKPEYKNFTLEQVATSEGLSLELLKLKFNK